MTGTASPRPQIVLLLCEDTYHSPLARLATDIFGGLAPARIQSEHVRRSLLLDARRLRAKVWASSRQWRGRDADLVQVHGFIDSEDSPRIAERALTIERQVADGQSGTAPAPCPVRLHVLKPNQEGLLLGAVEPLLAASATAVDRLGGQSALDAAARAAIQGARRQLNVPGKRPTTKAGVMRLFDDLFARRRKSFYMPIIGDVPGLNRAAFQPEPECMKALPQRR